MTRAVIGLALGAILVSMGCTPEDPQTTKEEFPTKMAEAVCRWITGCCDSAEQTSIPGGGLDLGACSSQLATQYRTMFSSASEDLWNGLTAQELVDDVLEAATTCPRAFDPNVEMGSKELVTPTKQPGDLCENTWDCSTKFCKSGVCANPLPSGSSCAAGEPCADGLRCIEDSCKELQPDGAKCTVGAECYTGACLAGKCAMGPYTCDGENL
jgi:hypothetical protein